MRQDYDEDFWEHHSATMPADPLRVLEKFEDLLNENPKESLVQEFLEEEPWILAEQFPHCYHVLPQFSFAGQYRADFVLPERMSGGTMMVLVELERPGVELVISNGSFAETVRTGLDQIRTWMNWLNENRDLARKARSKGGLGLYDYNGLAQGLLVVGRRASISDTFNDHRNRVRDREAIRIVTYDHVLDWARKRAMVLLDWHKGL